MDKGILPENGTALVGPVALPAGQRVYTTEGGEQLVAWVTSEPMADAGSAWWELCQGAGGNGPGPDHAGPAGTG
jgi:hypothetical protein